MPDQKEERSYQYDAFISYRHRPIDKDVAIRLQQLLEKHKKPDGEPLRIFRDQSELPTSGDLGMDIRTAVEQSRYLIVVCSPAYSESKWCMEEVNYFRRLHGDTNQHILPILVEGEPEESFPEQLHHESRTIEGADGSPVTVQVDVEPLGADVRAATDKERRKLLRTEYLRIAAPLLGCGFDELYQRRMRQKRRKLLIGSGVTVAAAMAFAGYSYYMFHQIYQAQQALYANQSERLAGEALELADSDPKLAMLLADIALPEKMSDPERPLSEEAALAMRSVALQAELQQAAYFEIQMAAYFDSNQWRVGNFYDNGRKVSVFAEDTTWLYDTRNGQLLAEVPSYETYFNKDASEYAYVVHEQTAEGWTARVYLHDTVTGERLGEGSVSDVDKLYSVFVRFNEENGRREVCTYTLTDDGGEAVVMGWFDENGKAHPAESYPDNIRQYPEDDGISVAHFYLNHQYTISGWSMTQYDYNPDEAVVPVGDAAAIDACTESYGPESYRIAGVTRTEDEKLLLLHLERFVSPYDSATVVWSVEEERIVRFIEAASYWEEGADLLYVLYENELQILSCHTENLVSEPLDENTFVYISEDGSRLAQLIPSLYYDGYMLEWELGVYNVSEENSMLFQYPLSFVSMSIGIETAMPVYHFNPAMDRVVLVNMQNQIELWEINDDSLSALNNDMCLFSLDCGENMITTVCTDSRGERIAVLGGTDEDAGEDYFIQVWDVASGQCIVELNPADFEEECAYRNIHLEFCGDTLLMAFQDKSVLYDVAGQKVISVLEIGTFTSYGEPYSTGQDFWFTEDGLLLIPESVLFSGENDSFRLRAIYDVADGTQLYYSDFSTMYHSGFAYCAENGTLVIQDGHEFQVLRRGDGGGFEQVLCIVPETNDLKMDYNFGALDGQYLLLQNEACCEIYDVNDGTRLYTVEKDTEEAERYGITDGILYQARTGRADGYALPTTEQARMKVREWLAEGSAVRVLSKAEQEKYYIPEEWIK